jgi:GntR family transcriptional regulator/MocR family aminotransferase
MADRFTAMLGQEALTDFITSGQFERYLRRASHRNASRRRVLIGALTQELGKRVEFSGANAGVHVLVWLNDVPPSEITSLIDRAADAGVGVYSITQYYSRPPNRAGLLFGYASLTEAEIRAGIRRFAALV